MDQWLFTIHIASTWYMVGLIWFVQWVHYPMMSLAADFVDYERIHQQRTTWAVGPAMLLEAGTLLALAAIRPPSISLSFLIGSGVLLALIWISTAAIQVPAHHRLSRGFDPAVHRWLVQSNWLRTVCWTARGIWVLTLIRC